MKTCFKCGISKPLSDYYRHQGMADGRLNKCKECAKSDVRKNRDENLDRYREFDRNRFHNDKKRREYHYDRVKQMNKKYPEKRRARNISSRALISGKIVKMPCQSCGKEGEEMHHKDYSKPLDVVWFCRLCHAKWHKENKSNTITT